MPWAERGGSEMVRLYAAADKAVAVIENGRVQLTLKERGARCLAVAPTDPDTVYVGASDEGLFKSTDGGRSWEWLSGVASDVSEIGLLRPISPLWGPKPGLQRLPRTLCRTVSKSTGNVNNSVS